MWIVISLSIPGEPVSKERPRTVNGHTYTPQKTLDHEAMIKDIWNLKVRKWNPMGRFHVMLEFRVERDNKDIDNMIKTVLDALNKLAWDDDRQVQRITAWKLKHNPGSTEIVVARMDEAMMK